MFATLILYLRPGACQKFVLNEKGTSVVISKGEAPLAIRAVA